MAAEEEGDAGGIPEWVVTFGDMMSLLLTFFIMLVSLSEMKEEDKYQALVESMQQQFGYQSSQAAIIPGHMRPRNSAIKKLATVGRAKKKDTMKGGDKVQAPVGDHPLVRVIRQGSPTSVGTVIYFEEGAAKLTDAHREILRQQVLIIQGKPQKLELRGHTSRRPATQEGNIRDNWDLAYERCRLTKEYLVDVMKIDANRIRMAVAGSNEPVHMGTDPDKLRQNPRVEVFLLDEVVRDLEGTDDEQTQRYVEE